jgi:hypothetical protein
MPFDTTRTSTGNPFLRNLSPFGGILYLTIRLGLNIP